MSVENKVDTYSHEDWQQRIVAQMNAQHSPLVMAIPHRVIDSFARPVMMEDYAGTIYFVKTIINGRFETIGAMFAETVIGRIGIAMKAPVANVELVLVKPEILRGQRDLRDHMPGIAHGSRQIRQAVRMENFAFSATGDNPHRYAELAVLYGLTGLKYDHQFLFDQDDPHNVWSFDHGMGLCQNGKHWNVDALERTDTAEPDAIIVKECMLPDACIQLACAKVKLITNDDIVNAVSVAPSDWGISVQDRIAVAKFIAARRDFLSSGATKH